MGKINDLSELTEDATRFWLEQFKDGGNAGWKFEQVAAFALKVANEREEKFAKHCAQQISDLAVDWKAQVKAAEDELAEARGVIEFYADLDTGDPRWVCDDRFCVDPHSCRHIRNVFVPDVVTPDDGTYNGYDKARQYLEKYGKIEAVGTDAINTESDLTKSNN